MNLKFITVLLFLLASSSSYGEGGSVGNCMPDGENLGNGGIGIQCEGQPLKVLDYYDAEKAGSTLNLKKFKTRNEFYQFIYKRLNGTKNIGLADEIIRRINLYGPADSWETIASQRTYDEALSDSIPLDCKLTQLAIFRHGRPHLTLEGATLSQEQKWVLELHEAAYSMMWDERPFTVDGSTTRRFVSTALKNSVLPREMTLEAYRFYYPSNHWYYKYIPPFHVSLESDNPPLISLTNEIYERTAPAVSENCPKYIAFNTAVDAGSHLYLYYEQQNQKPKMRDLIIRDGKIKTNHFTTKAKFNDGQNITFEHIRDDGLDSIKGKFSIQEDTHWEKTTQQWEFSLGSASFENCSYTQMRFNKFKSSRIQITPLYFNDKALMKDFLRSLFERSQE